MAEADEFQTTGRPRGPDAGVNAGGVGARLRSAREAAGLSITDIATRTRVSERHLAAIEESRFADLASRTYAIGFARAYARSVGLDEHAAAADVRAEMDRHVEVERPRPVTFDHGDPARIPGRRLAWLAALGVALAIAAVFYAARSYFAPAVPLEDLSPQASATPGVLPSAVPSAAAPTAAPSGPVVFTATEPNIWVKFYDGTGRQLMQKQMAQGESYTVPADAVGPKVWTGRGDAFQVTIGGRAVAPLASGPGKLKDVPVDAASLLKRGLPAPAAATAPPATSAAPATPPAAAPQ